MAVAIDPVFSNIFFTLGLLPHIMKKKNGYYSPRMDGSFEQSVISILIPLYREPPRVIRNLFSCLVNQTYDHSKIEIVLITEPDDMETNRYLKEITDSMQDGFLSVKCLVTDGMEKMKPYALNWGLSRCSGEIIGLYDAECEPESDQVAKAISAMYEMDYDLAQTKIEVVSQNMLGEFFKLDIFTWTEIFLPFVNEKARSFPLGTKGLFIRRDCLEEIGGFPLHLTEDAMMTIPLSVRNKKFGLVDSVTKEQSVRTWGTHFKQRRRWFRGYLSCLWELMRAKMPLKRKFWLSIPYISPIVCVLTLFGLFFVALYFSTWYFNIGEGYDMPWMTGTVYNRFIFYWSLLSGYIGLPLTLFSYLYAIADGRLENKVAYVYLIPLYWVFVGMTALSSFFKDTKNWDKTMREI